MRESVDYYKIWFEDKRSILATMVQNMAADLDAGFDYFGNCITKQRREIDDYKQKFDDQIMWLAEFDSDAKVNRWCKADLLRRGAIEL